MVIVCVMNWFARLIKLIAEALRSDKAFCKEVGIDPTIAGRGSITGKKGSSVWDYLSHQALHDCKDFTECPHFTVNINQLRLNVSITIPNRTKPEFRNRLRNLEYKGFEGVIETVVSNMKPLYTKDDGYRPWCIALQRRYASQRAKPTNDAVLEFDLRTAMEANVGPVKLQTQWLQAAFEAYCQKNSNYLLQIGASIEFDKSETLKSDKALKYIKQTWLACMPLINEIVQP